MILYNKTNIPQIFLFNQYVWDEQSFSTYCECTAKQNRYPERKFERKIISQFIKEIHSIFRDHLFLLKKYNVTFAQTFWQLLVKKNIAVHIFSNLGAMNTEFCQKWSFPVNVSQELPCSNHLNRNRRDIKEKEEAIQPRHGF